MGFYITILGTVGCTPVFVKKEDDKKKVSSKINIFNFDEIDLV